MNTTTYPVHVDAHLDPRLTRWQWLFKWLLAIPHYVVLAFLWAAFVVLSFVAFFAILFTGRYPRGIFDFNVGVLRWTWRVTYYAYGALGTDRYPPFTLSEDPDYPAHLEIDYPEHLSRGLVLVKWWLLALPHYLVLALFLGGAGYAASDADAAVYSVGLIGVLVIVAAVVLLFTGRYPQPVFDLVVGLNRWVLRVAAYAALMTDAYPPFRLDQGSHEVAELVAEPPVAPPAAGAVGGTAPVAGRVGPAPATPGWGAGRIVAAVVGSVVLLGSIAVGLAGAGLAVADRGLRDSDGFLMSGTTELTTATYAIASTSVTVHADAPPELMPDSLLGEVKITARSEHGPVFLGIAATADAEAYLDGVEHATLTDFADGGATYETTGTDAPAVPPTASAIWVAQSSGGGTQEIVWPVADGDWTVVVMNADSTRGVSADVAAGATLPALDWLVPVLFAVAGLGMVVGIVLMVVALRSTTPTPRSSGR